MRLACREQGLEPLVTLGREVVLDIGKMCSAPVQHSEYSEIRL